MQANLADGFVAHARANPSRAAFVLDDVMLSYQALLEKSDCWFSYLQVLFGSLPTSESRANESAHCKQSEPSHRQYSIPQNLIAWEGDNHIHLPALYLACLRYGCCLVLLDPSWPRERTEQVCRGLALQHRVTAETDPGTSVGRSGSGPGDSGVLSDCFLMGFTSGSTGFPKAFVRTQHSWLVTFNSAREEFGNAARGQVLAPGPLSHGLSFYAMAETLNAGGTFYCQARFDAADVCQMLQQGAITTLVVVPTMLVAILNTDDSAPVINQAKTHAAVTSIAKPGAQKQAAPLRILSAGAKLDPSVLKALTLRWPDTLVSEYYGASELSFVSVAHANENAPPESVGRAFTGVSIGIRNTEGTLLPTGEAGIVWVTSEMLALGTLEPERIADDRLLQPVALRETADQHRATAGDIGRLDAQGNLYLLDRANNMIISGGLNVSPAAVETVLRQLHAILDCAVVGLADDYWGERVCAVVQLSTGVRLSIREFDVFCKNSLAAEQIPRQVFTTELWPMTSSGKLARNVLKQQLTMQPDLFGRLDA